MNLGSKGRSGSVLQYLTRQTMSTRRSPGPPAAPDDDPEVAGRLTGGAPAGCGGFTVGGIFLF